MDRLTLSEQPLFELFSQLTSWQERYRQLITLAKLLPELSHDDKTAQYEIDGCENNVWLKVIKQSDGTFLFAADSDGRIVKGLLAILVILTTGKTAQEIKAIHFDDCFNQLKISEELSHSRLIGLHKLIAHILEQVNTQ